MGVPSFQSQVGCPNFWIQDCICLSIIEFRKNYNELKIKVSPNFVNENLGPGPGLILKSGTVTETGTQNQKIRDSGPGLKIEKSGNGDWDRDSYLRDEGFRNSTLGTFLRTEKVPCRPLSRTTYSTASSIKCNLEFSKSEKSIKSSNWNDLFSVQNDIQMLKLSYLHSDKNTDIKPWPGSHASSNIRTFENETF